MIIFDQVSISYAEKDGELTKPVIQNASFHINEGDLTLLVGRTGVGKSTVLNAINGLVPWFSGGKLTGTVSVNGKKTSENRPRDLAATVGYVSQNPLLSFVTDTVEDEIAYGMEQIGLSPTAMRKRVEETLDLMGIAELRRRPLLDLSGGQQQRVAIAAVLAAQPKVVVLDEPTSALDPTAAQDVLAAIVNLVQDVGLTVVMAEHRLERVMRVVDNVIWLPGDGSIDFGPAAEVLLRADVVPPLAALSKTLGWPKVPLSVREARRRVRRERIEVSNPPIEERFTGEKLASVKKLGVRYGNVLAVADVSVDFYRGEVAALMGRNGAGKSSLLWALQGGIASSGSVKIDGVDPRKLTPGKAREIVSLVPQTASDLLYRHTVAEECEQADTESGVAPGTTSRILDDLGASLPMDRHPRDLSEGQRLALVLAIQLAASPDLVLLDEPTRGLDYTMKAQLISMVKSLARKGKCVIISTHDVEFAASATSRMLIMADGDIVADGPTRLVCTSSPAYSPQISKVFLPVSVMDADEVAQYRIGQRQSAHFRNEQPGIGKPQIEHSLIDQPQNDQPQSNSGGGL